MPSTASSPVDGVVLAAGRSSRMGRPKPLIEIEDRSFLERAVEALRGGGCRRIVVVAPVSPAAVAEAGIRLGAHVIINERPDAEQIDSLRLALDALEADAEAVVVLPVDHPLVRPATVAAVLEAFRARRRPVVRASYHGRAGHPTLFARALFDELHGKRLERGAESVVARHASELEDVVVDDVGVAVDIDSRNQIDDAEERK